MNIKKNKKLYILKLMLNLFIFNAFTFDSIDLNENNNQEILRDESYSSDARKKELDNEVISFEIYEPIISDFVKLFESIMQINIEKNKSYDDIIKLFEKLNFNTVQGVVLKYADNIKVIKIQNHLSP